MLWEYKHFIFLQSETKGVFCKMWKIWDSVQILYFLSYPYLCHHISLWKMVSRYPGWDTWRLSFSVSFLYEVFIFVYECCKNAIFTTFPNWSSKSCRKLSWKIKFAILLLLAILKSTLTCNHLPSAICFIIFHLLFCRMYIL